MFKVRNLSKKFGNRLVVKDVTFNLKSKEIICLAGPNGSGKTTIINCILNIICPDKGEISLDGVKNKSHIFKERLAYVPDDLLLLDSLTGREYLEFINTMYGNKKNDKIVNVIKLYSMEGFLNLPIEKYSHGMKKKTQLIAAFMLSGTKLLILDEPFGGLDIESIIITKKLFKKYVANGGSILISTHDLEVAEKFCNKAIILSDGKILAMGQIEKLLTEHNSKSLEEVFSKLSITRERRNKIEEIIHNF